MPDIKCAECGSNEFYRWEGGSYTERQRISFQDGQYSQIWDKLNQDVMTTQSWLCINKHDQPSEMQDAIEGRLVDA